MHTRARCVNVRVRKKRACTQKLIVEALNYTRLQKVDYPLNKSWDLYENLDLSS